jgi:hypothetical protein
MNEGVVLLVIRLNYIVMLVNTQLEDLQCHFKKIMNIVTLKS